MNTFTHPFRAAVAAAAILAVVAAGCGDDDDDAGSEDTSSEADGPDAAEVAAGDDGGDGRDAYCDAILAVETAPRPDVDFDTATPEEISAALQAWAADVMKPLADEVVANVPADIAEPTAVLAGAVDDVASTGDPSAFESPEFAAAQEETHPYDLASCGWTEQAVTLAEYSFTGIPAELPAGPTSFEVGNDGQELHELGLVRVNDGVTESTEELLELPEDEVMEKIAFVGDPAFVEPGGSAYKIVDLEPGRYIAACFIPVGTTGGDQEPPADAPPHAFHGMVTEFTVQ